MQKRRSFLSTAARTQVQTVDAQADERGSVLQLAKIGCLYIWLWHIMIDWQSSIQTDGRSSSRFSAYLFFQRACQTVEKHFMQTEKVSECHVLASLVCFHFVSLEKVNFRVYNAHSVTREDEALPCYLCLSPSFFLSPCRLIQQCLMEKRWWLKVRGGNRCWRVEAAVCKTTADKEKLQHKYREKLWGRWLVNGSWVAPSLWCVTTELC